MTGAIVAAGLLLLVLIVTGALAAAWLKGHRLFGRFETDTHNCRLPCPWSTDDLPDGTRWRCRRCKRAWVLHDNATLHKTWRLDRGQRITDLEKELGIGGDG